MDNEAAVLAADDQFFAALNAMFDGDSGPLAELMSHADDVVYLGPSREFLVGWSAVRKDLERQAAMKLGGHLEPVERRVTLGDGLAVTYHVSKGVHTNTADGRVEVTVRDTNVFRKEDGRWRLIAHQVDPLPFLSA